MTDTLTDLIEKLKAGSGPDRELDVSAMLALYPGSTSQGISQDGLFDIRIPGQAPREVPRFTTSLDACIGLMKEVLPERAWSKQRDGNVHIFTPDGSDWTVANHTDLCRALLIAILQAMNTGDAG